MLFFIIAEVGLRLALLAVFLFGAAFFFTVFLLADFLAVFFAFFFAMGSSLVQILIHVHLIGLS